MASLYDDIDLKSSEKRSIHGEGWTSGIRLLQSQVQLKKATAMKGPSNKSRPAPSTFVAPVADLSSKKKDQPNMPVMGSLSKTIIEQEADLPLPWGNYKGTTLEKSSSLLFGEIEVEDEYNPMLPNDYDLIRRQRGPIITEKQRLRDEEARARRSRERERSPEGSDEEDEGDGKGRHNDRDDSRPGGIAIAPPTALIEEDKKVFEEPQMPPPPSGSSKGLGVAAKIMEKYGYRQGQGLGKQEQGMSTALQVEKVSKNTGKIIHERDRDGLSITEILKNPTKVVLLQNMVGPGEVDEELEPEIKQECGKYGEVYDCTVYEVPNPSCDEDAVRVFLEFAKVEQAIKAVVDLNGRYFGGRMVKAAFYDVDRFRRKDLALDM